MVHIEGTNWVAISWNCLLDTFLALWVFFGGFSKQLVKNFDPPPTHSLSWPKLSAHQIEIILKAANTLTEHIALSNDVTIVNTLRDDYLNYILYISTYSTNSNQCIYVNYITWHPVFLQAIMRVGHSPMYLL